MKNKKSEKYKERFIPSGIIFLICALVAIACFWAYYYFTLGLKENNHKLEYEVSECLLETRLLKKDFQERLVDDKLEKALWLISQREYDYDNYNCVNFSRDLKYELTEIGIKSSIVKGKWNDKEHYWIVIWIEPVMGKFIEPDEKYNLEKIIEEN